MDDHATRPFRFGVSLWTAASAAEWRAKARRAEELGYDVILVPDHVADLLPPLTALMAAADATERVHLGTLVLNNDFHNPVLLAREAASLQLLSGGRFELGLGAGHMQSEYAAAGIRYDPAAARVDRLEASVATLRGLFAGEPLAGGQLLYPPLQEPIPLLVGGNGRRVLQLAARQADIVGFTGFFPRDGGRAVDLSHFSAAGLASRVALVRAAAGPRFAVARAQRPNQAVVPAPAPRLRPSAQVAPSGRSRAKTPWTRRSCSSARPRPWPPPSARAASASG